MAHTKLATRSDAALLPKRGPTWTFYLLTIFAALVVAATVIGLRHAGFAVW